MNDQLTPRITHDRGLWAATALAALTAVIALTLGAGFDMAGARHWPILDDIAHATGWLALAGWITAHVRGAHRAGGDTGARVEAHIQSVREELRADRDRQAKEIAQLREAVEAIPDLVAQQVQAIIDAMEERQAAEFLTRSDATMDRMSGQGNVRSIIPETRRGGA